MFHEELAGVRCFPFIFLKGLAPKVVDWYGKQTGRTSLGEKETTQTQAYLEENKRWAGYQP